MNWAGNAIAGKIRMLGRDVRLQSPTGEVVTKAIIDPVSSVSEAARTAVLLPDGYYGPGSYQYFGLPYADLSQVETVLDGQFCYHIRRRELYQAGDQKLYWWALMLRGGSEDEEA